MKQEYPIVDQIGPLWGVWVDSGDEICVCWTKRDAEKVKRQLIKFRRSAESSNQRQGKVT